MRPADELVPDPAAERELAAIDAALAGEAVESDLAGLAALAHAVRAERPSIDAEFAALLDARAAEGFPRSDPAGPGTRTRRRLGRTLHSLRARIPRRVLLPALGAAASLLAALVLVASLVGGGGDQARTGGLAPKAGSPSTLGEKRSAEGATGSAEGPGGATALPIPPDGEDGLAPGRPRRVERQASLVLEAPEDEVGEVADGVVRAVDQVGGIVVTSSVSSGAEGGAGATFSLRVPTRRLEDALARLSKLGHVRSRTQNSQDVTGAYVSASERLEAARAERKGLLRQLARANTPNETASIRERLRIVQAEIASARAALRRLRTRTDFSAVSVTVESGARGSSGTGAGGTWTPGDALDDAVRVLEVALGITMVALALLVPLALLAALGALAGRSLRRHRRERALDAG